MKEWLVGARELQGDMVVVEFVGVLSALQGKRLHFTGPDGEPDGGTSVLVREMTPAPTLGRSGGWKVGREYKMQLRGRLVRVGKKGGILLRGSAGRSCSISSLHVIDVRGVESAHE